MEKGKTIKGHILAILCVAIWATSFIASKTLLATFTPLQLMVMRFSIAYISCWVVCPKWYFKLKDEGLFLLAALFSNTLYFIAESYALRLTQASNVSIMVATAPILTAILLRIFKQSGKFSAKRVIGYTVAFIGVICVVLNGVLTLKLSPAGDLLAIAAALMWAIYSIIIHRCFKGLSNFLITRKLMFYGLLTAVPLLLADGGGLPLRPLFEGPGIWYILYLGVICSTACYIAWNTAIRCLGVLKTNLYIYLIPLFTLAAGALLLDEKVTLMGAAGIVIVIIGMFMGSKE